MGRRPTFRAFLKEELKKPGFKKAFEAYDPEIELLEQLIAVRKKKGMTQEDVAKKMRVKQPSVGRMESGRISPSFGKIVQYADAVGERVVLQSKKSSRKTKKKMI